MSVTIPDRLETFYNTFNGKIDSLISSNNDLGVSLRTIKDGYVNVVSGVRSAWTDGNNADSINNLNLISSAVDRVAESSNSDFSSFLNEIKNVVNYVDDIKGKVDSVNSLKGEETINGKKVANDQAKIINGEGEINVMIRNAQGKLDALSRGLNDVTLGIKGNMVTGGSLGSYNRFNYSFVEEKYVPNRSLSYDDDSQSSDYIPSGSSSTYTNTSSGTGFIGAIGAFALGAVESVLKLGEGIVDAGATIVGNVVSLCGGDSKGIEAFIKEEHVNNMFDNIGIMNEHSFARSAGNVVGDVASFAGAAFLATMTAPVSILGTTAYAVANGGKTSEFILKLTDNLAVATGCGVVSGIVSRSFVRRAAQRVKTIPNLFKKVDKSKVADSFKDSLKSAKDGGVKLLEEPYNIRMAKKFGDSFQKVLKDGNILLKNGKIVDMSGKVIKEFVDGAWKLV